MQRSGCVYQHVGAAATCGDDTLMAPNWHCGPDLVSKHKDSAQLVYSSAAVNAGRLYIT